MFHELKKKASKGTSRFVFIKKTYFCSDLGQIFCNLNEGMLSKTTDT